MHKLARAIFFSGVMITCHDAVCLADTHVGGQNPVEIIVSGHSHASLKEYRRWKVQEEQRKKLVQREISVSKPVAKEGQPPTAPTVKLRSGRDENGWKTIWLDPVETGKGKEIAAAAGTGIQEPVGMGPTDIIEGKTADSKASETSTDKPMKLSRVLGISPPLSDLVKDFRKSAEERSVRIPKVSTVEELSRELEIQAANHEGPLFLISGQGRVRLMGLKELQEQSKGKTPDAFDLRWF